MAGVTPEETDWFLWDPLCGGAGRETERQALAEWSRREPANLPVGGLHAVCGDLGPAMPILHVLLAIHGDRTGRYWYVDTDGRFSGSDDFRARHVLINASGPQGQMATLILRGNRWWAAGSSSPGSAW